MKKAPALPRFIIYQPDAREFHICLEAGSVYYVWWSNYPPSQDNRFARKIKRLKAIQPLKIPLGKIYDQGTYSINKDDDLEAVEKKIKKGIKAKSFSFLLNGNILKGRFIIKQSSGGTIIRKFKDQYAAEEDIFSNDLSRTIRLMVPDYNPDSIQLSHHKPKKQHQSKKTVAPEVVEEEPAAITADLKVGKSSFHFNLYRSETGPDLCVVSNKKNEVLVLQKNGGEWHLLKAARTAVSKITRALTDHATLLYKPGKK